MSIARIHRQAFGREDSTKLDIEEPLAKFHASLSEDYRTAARRLAWDDHTLGALVHTLSEQMVGQFDTPDEAVSHSLMVLAKTLHTQNSQGIRMALPFPGAGDGVGYIGQIQARFSAERTESMQETTPALHMELVQDRESYPLCASDKLLKDTGNLVRQIAHGSHDATGDQSVVMVAMALNCWTCLARMGLPGASSVLELENIGTMDIELGLYSTPVPEPGKRPKP